MKTIKYVIVIIFVVISVIYLTRNIFINNDRYNQYIQLTDAVSKITSVYNNNQLLCKNDCVNKRIKLDVNSTTNSSNIEVSKVQNKQNYNHEQNQHNVIAEPLVLLKEHSKILEQHQEQTSFGAKKIISRVYAPDFKYPNLIIEETAFTNVNGEEIFSVEAMVADHVIVSIDPDISYNELKNVLNANGFTIRKKLFRNNHYLVNILDPKINSVQEVIENLKGENVFQSIEPDYLVYPAAIPNDPNFTQQWGMQNNGQSGGEYDADIDASQSWEHQTDCSGVLIAVIDTGIDYSNPDLVDNVWVNQSEIADNGIDDDGNGLIDDVYGYDFHNWDSDPKDDVGHGTHVAGIIGARGDNYEGVVGICWKAKLMALKFMGPYGGATSDALDAITYAREMGAEILNNSWGRVGQPNKTMKLFIKEVGEEGGLFITSAGNKAMDNDGHYPYFTQYPASYPLDCIISVAASDHDDHLAVFYNSRNQIVSATSYGYKTVDLVAPGKNIISTYINDSYTPKSGTSMATPHVTGACALLWSKKRCLSNMTIKESILDSTEFCSELVGKIETAGRLNLNNAFINTTNECNINKLIHSNNLLLYYDFEYDDGLNVFDVSGKGSHGLIRGNVTYEETDLNGKAVRISDPDSYVECFSSNIFMDGWTNLTVSVWVKMDKYTTYGTIISKNNTGNPNEHIHGCRMRIGGDYGSRWEDGYFEIFDKSLQRHTALAETLDENVLPYPSKDVWYHLAGVFNGTSLVYYVNGVKDNVEEIVIPEGTSIRDVIGTSLMIGKGGGSVFLWRDRYFNGYIDELRIYDIALNASEIKSIYDFDEFNQTTESLMLYYDFNVNENGLVSDLSGNGNNGVVNGLATWEAVGVGNGSYYFDGNDDSISTSFKPDYAQRTYSFWFKRETQPAHGQILLSTRNWGQGLDVLMDESNIAGSLRVRLDNGSDYQTSPLLGFDDEKWHHIAFTYDEYIGEINVYIDNEFIDMFTFSGTMTDSTDLWIGRRENGHQFKGSIDEVKIYNRILSTNHITQLYHEGLSIIDTAELVLHYNFNKDENGMVTDQSSFANNGVAVNGASWTNVGVGGGAYAFDGLNDYINIPDDETLRMSTNSFSISAWFKTSKQSSKLQGIFYKCNPSKTAGEKLFRLTVLHNSGYLNYNMGDNVTYQELTTSGTDYRDGQWHHVVFVRDRVADKVRLYVEGVEVVNSVDLIENSLENTFDCNIGGNFNYVPHGNSQYFEGLIDEVKVYLGVLTSNEIAVMHNEEFINIATNPLSLGPEGSLMLHYSFDGDNGTNVIDSSGRGNHGLVRGSVSYEDTDLNGKAILISDADSYVECLSDEINMNGWTNLTVSAWVKMNDYTSYGTVLWRHNPDDIIDDYIGCRMRIGGVKGGSWGSGYFSIFDESKESYSAISETLNDNVYPYPAKDKWYHLVGVFDGTSVVYYVNGKKDNVSEVVFPEVTSIRDVLDSSLFIGKAGGGATAWNDRYLNGYLDEIRIYKAALTELGVMTLYELDAITEPIDPNPCLILKDNLRLYYNFEGDNGVNVIDSSGNANHGLIRGDVSYSETDLSGKAIRISDPDSYVECLSEDLNMNGWTNLTVSAWVKMDKYTTYGTIISANNTGNPDEHFHGFRMRIGGDYGSRWEEGYFEIFDKSLQRHTALAETLDANVLPYPSKDVWYHLTGVFDGTSLIYYVNGEKDNVVDVVVPEGTSIRDVADTSLMIGKAGGSVFSWTDRYLNGFIDEVRIYNVALTASEVQSLYNFEECIENTTCSDRQFSLYGDIVSNLDTPATPTLGDIDNDGDIDLVVPVTRWLSDPTNAAVVWYSNNGNERYGEQQIIYDGIDGLRNVELIDIDKNGSLDVFYSSRSIQDGTVSAGLAWQSNVGNGSFTAQNTIYQDSVESFKFADLDDDGDLDILSIIASPSDKIGWFKNNSDSTFSEFIPIDDLDDDNNLSSSSLFQILDVDEDGDKDVVVRYGKQIKTAGDEFWIAWYENDGAGNFGLKNEIVSDGYWNSDISSCDVDSDGDDDLVISRFIEGDFVVIYNDVGTTFNIVTGNIPEITSSSFNLVDYNEDGNIDLITHNRNDYTLAWFKNTGTGLFEIHQITELYDDVILSNGDIDGDGDIDILATLRNANKIMWYDNNCGQISQYIEWLNMNVADRKYAISSADSDGDGLLNFLEYAMGTDPDNSNSGWNNTPYIPHNNALSNDVLMLTFTIPDPPPADVVYRVQGRDDLLSGDWQDIAVKLGSYSWKAFNADVFEIQGLGVSTITVKDDKSMGSYNRRFMRLVVGYTSNQGYITTEVEALIVE